MKQLRVTVSDIDQANRVHEAGALPVFSLRTWAMNANSPVLPEDCRFPFPFGLMMNRPVSQGEMDTLKNDLQAVLETNAQWIYFSDPSFLRFCDEINRRRLIYRPETLVTSSADALFWLDQGIGEVSVSPLLTIEETQHLLQAVNHAEVTIHGHQLLSVSKRQLLSAWKQYYDVDLEIKGNRHLYLKESTRQEAMPVWENKDGTMIFTDYVMESFDVIDQLARAQAGLIEGSFLEPEALIEAVTIYNSLLQGKDETDRIAAYRAMYPQCYEGYYGQKTIL